MLNTWAKPYNNLTKCAQYVHIMQYKNAQNYKPKSQRQETNQPFTSVP